MNMSKYFIAVITSSVFITNPALSQDTGVPTNKLSQLDCSTNQIAKYDGDGWVCADHAQNTGNYVIKDSNGHEFGHVIITNKMLLDERLDVIINIIDDNSNPRTLMANFSPHQVWTGDTVYFKNDTCTGDERYINNDSISKPNIFANIPDRAISQFDLYDESIISLWVIEKTYTTISFTPLRVLESTGGCVPFSGDASRLGLYRLEKVISDFNAKYPKTYTIERK